MKYLLYVGEELVGGSALELADPPMGCVAGVFYPNENYEKIKEIIREYSECCAPGVKVDKAEYEKAWFKVVSLGFVVRPEQGQPFEPVGGISLLDYSEELGDETGRELSVFGLPHEIFAQYFHEANEQYWKQ